jgi:hypothetical protein
MLNDAPNIKQRILRQAGIFIASKNRVAVLPNGLMAMHTGAIVRHNRLRHEGRRLTITLGHHVYGVFVELDGIGGARQCFKADAKLMLTRRHLMVMLFDFHAHVMQNIQHLVPDLIAVINWRRREVTALWRRTVAEIAMGIVGA